MEIHVAISILLDYSNEFAQWKIARLLNRTAKCIVDTKKYEKECYGRSTFLRTEWCSICEKTNPKVMWLRYDELGRTSYITHCPTWFCSVSAVHSMIAHCRDNERVLLRVPWQKSIRVVIPRSDGSESHGHCKINHLVIRPTGYYVETEWQEENGKMCAKLVPLTYYSAFKPKIMSI